jgi:hypothetical protein
LSHVTEFLRTLLLSGPEIKTDRNDIFVESGVKPVIAHSKLSFINKHKKMIKIGSFRVMN